LEIDVAETAVDAPELRRGAAATLAASAHEQEPANGQRRTMTTFRDDFAR
jgi:hypothetical protein